MTLVRQWRWSALSSWTSNPNTYVGQWECPSLVFSCMSLQRGRDLSKLSDRPSLGPLSCWGQVYAPRAAREGTGGELAGCLLSYMAENNFSAGSLPPQKVFLSFSSGRKSGLVVPYAEADLVSSIWPWTGFTILQKLVVKLHQQTLYNWEESVKTTIWNAAKCNSDLFWDMQNSEAKG